MRYPTVRNAVLAALISGCSLPSLAAEAGTQSVDAAWATAMQANDIEAVMKNYAPDAVAWFPERNEARGAEAIRASYEGLLTANTVVSASVSDASYRTVGSRSVGWGKFSMTLQPKVGGSPIVMTGRFTEVAERRHGRWVYIVDHASAEPAAAVAASQ